MKNGGDDMEKLHHKSLLQCHPASPRPAMKFNELFGLYEERSGRLSFLRCLRILS